MDSAASPEPITVQDMLARSEALVMADSSHDPDERAAILATIAGQYGALSDYAQAAKLYERALALTARSRDRGLHSSLVCAHAIVTSNFHDAAAVAMVIDRELATLRADPDNATYCALYRSYVARDMGDAAGMLRFAEQALEYYRAGTGTNAIDEGLLLGALADAHRENDRYVAAERYYRLAVEKFTALGRSYNANAITVLSNWALLSLQTGAPRNALTQYDRILQALAQRGPTKEPPLYVTGNRASALEDLGRYAEAQSLWRRELSAAVRQKGVEGQARSLLGLASTAIELHDLEGAGRYLEQMSQLLRAEIPSDAPPYRALAVAQGRLALKTGRLSVAREKFERALTMKGSASTKMIAHLGKSEVELQSGLAMAAEQQARAALTLAKAAQGDLAFSCYTGESWLMLGRALQVRGEIIPARAAFESAVEHLANTVDSSHPQLRQARELLGAATG